MAMSRNMPVMALASVANIIRMAALAIHEVAPEETSSGAATGPVI